MLRVKPIFAVSRGPSTELIVAMRMTSSVRNYFEQLEKSGKNQLASNGNFISLTHGFDGWYMVNLCKCKK
jgi:hypothetical protein